MYGALPLESFGLPLPGEAMLIAGALLAAQSGPRLIPLLITAWGAAVLGDIIGYAVGRFGGRRLIARYGARIGITESRLAGVEAFLQREGRELALWIHRLATWRSGWQPWSSSRHRRARTAADWPWPHYSSARVCSPQRRGGGRRAAIYR